MSNAMRAWDKGPAGLFEPGSGQTFWQPQPTAGYVTLTMTPETFKHDASACGVQTIPPGGRIEPIAHRAAEKILYVLSGKGTLTIEGEARSLVPGSMVTMGRKIVHAVVNNGGEDLTLFFWVTPPGYEDYLACIGRPRTNGQAAPTFQSNSAEGQARALVITNAAELAAIAREAKGDWMVVGPDEGSSYWQAAPAGGFIQFKAYPEVFDSNRFIAAIQVLPPGGQIPPHAHSRMEEWLLIRTGYGRIFVDGKWHAIKPGSLGFVSRWITHSIINESDVDMEVFAIATPPGLELLLRQFSLKANPGDAPPDLSGFTLPDNADELLQGAVLRMPGYAAKHNAEDVTRPGF